MYKIQTWSNILLIVLGSFVLLGGIFIPILATEIATIGIIISLLATCVGGGGAVVCGVIDLIKRKKILNSFARVIGPLCFIDETKDGEGSRFALLTSRYIANDVRGPLSLVVKDVSFSNKMLEPYILIYIKDKGEVKYKGVKAHGLAYHNTIEIEYTNYMNTRGLLYHELLHIFLNRANIKRDKQHAIIKETLSLM